MGRDPAAPAPRTIEVRRTYLTMDSPAALRPAREPAQRLDAAQLHDLTVPAYRALYRDVGAAWHWRDRDAWTDVQLAAHLARAEIHVWLASVDGRSAGYFELERHADGAVEILYFGLLPEFIGRGFGGALLTRAAREAWRMGATRVWLHTCTLDAPQALPNYLARGFRIVREEIYTATIG